MGRQTINKQTNTNCNKFSRGNEGGAVNKNREVVEDLINLPKGTARTEVEKTKANSRCWKEARVTGA